MSVTIQQLVENPSLKTRLLAGESGASRPVLWAHTCELPDPWNWLGTGDLLLTDGYNFPADAEGQVAFLSGLAQANLSGIALAAGLHASPVTPEAKAVADKLAFPVMETAYAVPFVTVARTVADSNSHGASGRLVRILRIYDVLRRSNQSASQSLSLVDGLSRECDATLHVLDVAHGADMMPMPTPLATEIRDAVMKMLEGRPRPFPAFMRLTLEHNTVLVLPAGAEDRAVMVALPTSDSQVDLVVLQHAATIVTLEVERRAAAAVRRRESGTRLFQQLLDHSIDGDAAATHLAAVGLIDRPWRVACWGEESGIDAEDLQFRLTTLKVPHLLIRSGDEHLALVADSAASPDLFGFAQDSRVRAGISQPIQTIGQIADAAREARWAVEAARSNRVTVCIYGEQSPTFLPRTVAEGEAVVAALLGPVITYDEESDSELMHSLEVYFDSNRSWQRGADRLGIHKQTLAYRMRRVEALTGRRLSEIQDQTELYLALKTWQRLTGK